MNTKKKLLKIIHSFIYHTWIGNAILILISFGLLPGLIALVLHDVLSDSHWHDIIGGLAFASIIGAIIIGFGFALLDVYLQKKIYDIHRN